MTKFGQALKGAAHPPWAARYVRYKLLKKVIKCIISAEAEADGLPLASIKPVLRLLAPAELDMLDEASAGGSVSSTALEQFFLELIEVRSSQHTHHGTHAGTATAGTGCADWEQPAMGCALCRWP